MVLNVPRAIIVIGFVRWDWGWNFVGLLFVVSFATKLAAIYLGALTRLKKSPEIG